ncbi:hypothetical protein Bca4012_089366 [Brassica carinata]
MELPPVAPPLPMVEPPLPVIKDSFSDSNLTEKKSYVSAVQNKQVLVSYEVHVEVVDGAQMIQIPDEFIKKSVPLWDEFLQGWFLDTALHVAKIHILVNEIWPLGDKNIRIDVFSVSDTVVKFCICDDYTKGHILRRGMWNIVGIPIMISKGALVDDLQMGTR